MTARVVAAFVLLPFAIAAERFAYYAARAVSYVRISELGGDVTAMQSATVMPLLGAVAAGALAALLLPRVVFVAGALCTVAGWLLAARAGDVEGFTTALSVAGFGSGAMKACLYALALLVMPTPKLRVLYVLVTYLVINAVALVAPIASTLASAELGYEVLFTALAAVVTAGFVPALIVILVDKLAPQDAPPERRPNARQGRAVLGALAMIGATLPLFVGMNGQGMRFYEVLQEGGVATGTFASLHAIPTLVTMAALVGVAVWLGVSARAPAPSVVVGIALLVGAGAAALALVPTVPTALLAAAVFGVAEVAAPLALARGLANHHPRAVTFVVAITLAFAWVGAGVPPLAALIVAVPLLCVVGALLVAKGAALDAWLDAAPTPEPSRESWLSGRT